jgi:putative hydrolase of HD superfamily
MLAVVACAIAQEVAPHLDRGKIAQYSVVHDLVEAYSGDVLSLGISKEVREQKEQAERAALDRIRCEFKSLPWIASTIDEYESLVSEEARFVKVLDKVLPKLTHLLNDGAALREHGFTTEQAHRDHLRQYGQMWAKYPQEQALAVFYDVIERCYSEWVNLPIASFSPE